MAPKHIHGVVSTAIATWVIGLPLVILLLFSVLGALSWLLDHLPR